MVNVFIKTDRYRTDKPPINKYIVIIGDWWVRATDGDWHLEGTRQKMIAIQYRDGSFAFIHKGQKYSTERVHVRKWKPLKV